MTKLEFLHSVTHLVWWKTETEALEDIPFLIRQTMNYGSFKDYCNLEKLYTKEELLEILRNTLPGEMTQKTWNYWHIRLCDPNEKVPPLPENIITNGNPVTDLNKGFVIPNGLDIVGDNIRRYYDKDPQSHDEKMQNIGRLKERKQIAINMLKMGFAYVHITQATGLSKNDVRALIKNSNSSLNINENNHGDF